MSPLSRRLRSSAPGFLALALGPLLAGCDGDPDAGSLAAETPVSGGTAVVLLPAALQGLNPMAVTQNRSIQVQREVLFAPLVRYDRELEPRPWLAGSWDTTAVRDDSLALTFRIRDDARWHDGRPVSARDVAFTYRLMGEGAAGYAFRSELDLYDPRMTVVDARTVRVRLRRHAEFLEVWYQTPVLPAHLLEGVSADEVADHAFWDAPVGSGPFRWVGRAADGTLTFAANEDFPRALGGRPRLDTLVLRVSEGPGQALERAAAGGVHLLLDLAPAQVERVWAAPGLELVSYAGTQWTFIAWNHRRPWFDTAAERRALDRALDREELVDSVLRGLGEAGRATVTPSHPAYAAEPSPASDTLEARRLLAEAGWVDRDGDGVAEDAQGNPLRFSLVTNTDNPGRVAAARMVAVELRRAGADVRLDTVSFAELSSRLAGTAGPGGRDRRYDAALVGWADPIGKNDADLLHSSASEEPNGFVGYHSAPVDSLLERLARETDEAWAREAWTRYQSLVRDEVPVSVLFYPLQLAARSPRLRGVEMDARGSFPTVATWWLAPDTTRGAAAP